MTRSDAPERLGPLDWTIQILGWLALLASVALLSPGVVATANAEPLAAGIEAGPSCPAGASPDQVAAQLEQVVQRLRREAESAAAVAGEPGDDAVIVLNSRGYNYPSGLSPTDPAAPRR